MFGSFALIGAQKNRLWAGAEGLVRPAPAAGSRPAKRGFRVVLELEVRRLACHRCGNVKRERLDFLADNPHFTKLQALISLARGLTP
jgi:hypothetical protein